jgi:hypothetical protein
MMTFAPLSFSGKRARVIRVKVSDPEVARDLRARGEPVYAPTSQDAETFRARRPEVDGYQGGRPFHDCEAV